MFILISTSNQRRIMLVSHLIERCDFSYEYQNIIILDFHVIERCDFSCIEIFFIFYQQHLSDWNLTLAN